MKTLRRCFVLVMFLVIVSVCAEARRRQPVDAPAVASFDLSCATQPTFQRSGAQSLRDRILNDLRRNSRRPETYDSCERIDVAYAHDLDGDGTSEYFIPLTCGCRGECLWGVFSVGPGRYLGSFWAEVVYIRDRVDRYAALTVMSNEDVSTSRYATFVVRRGIYKRATPVRETRAGRNDFPNELVPGNTGCRFSRP
jgi:hypothetical protein